MHRALRLGVLFALLAPTGVAWAEEPRLDEINACVGIGGEGDPCIADTGEEGCDGNTYARLCAEVDGQGSAVGACRIPCDGDDGPERASCSLGENCVPGKRFSGGSTHICRPARFRMDLNLLDQCVVHFLDGTQPVFSENVCSLERNLNTLLDQNGDLRFDIFDLDLCVASFLEQPVCEAQGQCDAPDLVYCTEDDDCGLGLHCDDERNVCQRECGLITSREEDLGVLERACSGSLKLCDFDRGRCETIEQDTLERLTCEVDSECPPGAYCLVGRCAAECFRGLDCPDDNWICTPNNRCRARPSVDDDEGQAFDPKNYAIRFARSTLNIDAVENTDSAPLVIIDLTTKRQVRNRGSVAFGYRMEIDYGLKQDLICLQPFVECSDDGARSPDETRQECEDRQQDCFVSADEEWIRLLQPFGTINAAQEPTIEIALEDAVAENLTPGVYAATVRLIFDNGDSDTVQVRYTKLSPSGQYEGNLSIYLEAPEAALNASRPLAFGMNIKVEEERKNWDQLLLDNNIVVEQTLTDTTRGFVVKAQLDGNTTFAFTKGDAQTRTQDKVDFVGLYSPDLRRMRLIGVIDIPADFCIGENGPCNELSDTELRVENPFGRAIRRQIEFVGPFEDGIARFSGIYRERIVGLTPNGDLTFEGGFNLEQVISDNTPVPVDEPLIDADDVVPAFPDDTTVLAALDAEVTNWCGVSPATPLTPAEADRLLDASLTVASSMNSGSVAEQIFSSEAAFDAYMSRAKTAGMTNSDHVFGRSTIFPDVARFSDLIEGALSALSASDARADAQLNIYDFISDRLVLCEEIDQDGSASPSPACIDEAAVRCGLALHQRAIIRGWAIADQVAPPAAGTVDNGDCPAGQIPGTDGSCSCPVPEMRLVGGECLCGEGCECPLGQAKEGGVCVPDIVGAHDLFCSEAIDTTGCVTDGTASPDLFALQEHNRFWRFLGDITRFSAGKARSDAFLVLFRNAINPFAQGAALSFKSDKLREALTFYDDLNQLFLSPEAGKVLFRWPARAFKQAGNDWVGIIQAALSERMDVIADSVDLRRRVFGTSGATDFTFAQHLMQYEYLTQAYVMALQKAWQRELFGWEGQSDAIFEQGQAVINQLNPIKNSHGITDNRVFFENTDTEQSNWENYRDQLVGDDGLIAETREQIDGAVVNLQASLLDLDALEDNLDAAYEDLFATINEICGDPTPAGVTNTSGDYCQQLIARHHTYDDFLRIRSCAINEGDKRKCGNDDSFEFVCASDTNDTCGSVVAAYVAGTDGVNTGTTPGLRTPPSCALDTAVQHIDVNGSRRLCIGGEVGALLQEKALIDLQRRLTVGQVKNLTRQIKTLADASDAASARDELGDDQTAPFRGLVIAMEGIITALDKAEDIFKDGASGAECGFTAGFSFGTSCIGTAIAAVLKATFGSLGRVVLGVLAATKAGFEERISVLERDTERAVGDIEFAGELETLSFEVDALVDEYQVLAQESFNLSLQIDHQRFLAQEAAALYQREVTSISERLVGRETGNLLLGNDLVRASSGTFREAVRVGHKAAVAFAHHFNVSVAERVQLENSIASAVTIDDVEDFVGRLDRRARDYCGREAIDCDAGNNVETLRVSLRDLLYPSLRNIAGGPTAGEQFHNSITRPPIVRRRVRGTEVVDQIELPFLLPLDLRERIGGTNETWLIDPLSCNHMLVADVDVDSEQNGTVAANFVGQNLGGEGNNLRYNLVRGAIDTVRACDPEPVIREIGTLPILEYPKRNFVVGYAPVHSNANLDSPPSFFTVSQPFGACIDQPEANGTLDGANCWRYFARDRSLSAPDWTLIIPLQIGDGDTPNAWVLGETAEDDERPIIEDIVLYFRYRSRPINED